MRASHGWTCAICRVGSRLFIRVGGYDRRCSRRAEKRSAFRHPAMAECASLFRPTPAGAKPRHDIERACRSHTGGQNMSNLAGKRVLLIVPGGIAAFKVPELIRLLRGH